MAGSRAPLRVDALNLLVEVDLAVAAWTPDTKDGTPERLRELAARGWRPQDCELLDAYAAHVERWTLTAVELLGDAPVSVDLRFPCPNCGQRFTYRKNRGGEQVRTFALRVSEDSCTCLACRAVWAPAEFHFLARLLGCEALPM